MAELVDLVVLARVVERGSFARAAADLGVPPSTLSRRVAALERRLGVRVLERTTRHLRPTEIGELLAERGQRVRRELEDAERAVADHQRAPRGLLRRRQTWAFVGRGGATEDVELAPRANANSAPLVAQLAADGVGLALLPRSVAARAGLVVLEPGGFRPQAFDLSVVTPSARTSATKVRAFVDLMRDFVQARPDIFDAVVPTPAPSARSSRPHGRASA